jgi:hypothetical protein
VTLVRIHHWWYDGPVVAAEVEINGEWVGCNVSPYADELYDLLAEADTYDWPEGDYTLTDGQLTPVCAPESDVPTPTSTRVPEKPLEALQRAEERRDAMSDSANGWPRAWSPDGPIWKSAPSVAEPYALALAELADRSRPFLRRMDPEGAAMSANQSADAVVTTYRNRDHVRAWNEPAVNAKPSALTDRVASAWLAVREAADGQADALMAEGFQSGHAVLRDLRGMASDAARYAQRATAWAVDLRAAESELLPQPCQTCGGSGGVLGVPKHRPPTPCPDCAKLKP